MTVGISIGTMISSISSVSRKAPSIRNRMLTMSRNMAGDMSSVVIHAPMA